jgi:heavy metal sensor kinase
MKRLNIRWKLTLWYGGVLAVVLFLFSGTIYLTMRYQLLERTDQGLAEELADVRYEVKRADNSKSLLEWLDRRFARHEGFDFQITQPSGERFFVNTRLADKTLPVSEEVGGDGPRYETVELTGRGRWRIVTEEMPGPEGPLRVQVARSLASYDHELRELLTAFLLTGPLTLLLAVAGGYFLARRALAPVQRITETADQITADRLSQRVEVANPHDELGALGQTLNRMIGRLERSFAEMQQFTADAAHELRTPLAVIRNEAEVALRSPRSPDEYCHVLSNLLEETNRLTGIADQLLFLCRNDAGLNPPVREDVRGDELLGEVVGNMRLVAEAKGVVLTVVENPVVQMLSDSRQLRRVLYNLLDNAIKYTDAGGRVTVRSEVHADRWAVSVTDTGLGIAPEHLPRVFDRFYRVDPSRTGDGDGAGLGLAICQSILKGLASRIAVDSAVGQGTIVRFELPLRK